MKYEGVCIAVSDVKLAQIFYENLFELEVFQDYGINISFSCGISLQQDFDAVIGVPKDTITTKPHNMELYFEEDDFDGFIRMLDGLELVHPPMEHSWGQRVVRFYDPDGHILEVGENISAVARRFADEGMTLKEVATRMDVKEEYVREWLKGEPGQEIEL
jgi:catechol 2,3-dioxygenase-like lactoylglutathione lyase family enzyme